MCRLPQVPYMGSMFFFNSLNNHALHAIEEWNGTSLSPDTRALLSAGAVGVQVSLLLSPLELVRIQGQNQNKGGEGCWPLLVEFRGRVPAP